METTNTTKVASSLLKPSVPKRSLRAVGFVAGWMVSST